MTHLKPHFNYLRYVLCHKWFVFWECVRLGILRQGITHDLSRFSQAEWRSRVLSFDIGFRDHRPRWVKSLFAMALLHHWNANPHHYQYWVNRPDHSHHYRKTILESGLVQNGNFKMPEVYAKEMLADWRAMARQHGGSARKWYEGNRGNIVLHPLTRAWVEAELEKP